jgi:hypothetical protein
VPEAPPGAVPPVLVSPPWLHATKPAPPPTHELATLPFETEVHLTSDQARELGAPEHAREDFLRMFVVGGPVVPRTDAADAFVLEKLQRWTPYVSNWFDLLTEAGAETFFRERDLASLDPKPRHLRYLLARFGARAADAVTTAAEARMAYGTDADVLSHVESVRVAARFLDLARKKTGRTIAHAYFVRYPEVSAIVAIPLALAKKTQKAGLLGLRAVREAAGVERVLEIAERYGVRSKVEALLAWEGGVERPGPIPAFADPALLPPVVLRDAQRRLPADAVKVLLELLSLSDPQTAHPALDGVLRACTSASLAAFGWGLFQAWLAAGADAKADWAMTALGHLAGDDAARRLTALIRAWPGESAHARAVKGLDVLARIGTDAALAHLDAIAVKVKFKGLQERAREKIAEVATERGLSPEELADRIAPTLDLDPDGSRVLSFGTRTFKVGFDEHLAPVVTDEAGKLLRELPKPRKDDDPAAAREATEAWKLLRKDAKAIAQNQIHRLERAMCMQRRWSATDFDALLVRHPLVFHLVRRLLWGVHDGARRVGLFRVAEDRTLADEADAPFVLPDAASVGIVHRLELGGDEVLRWGQVFGDYEIVQPFSQIDRDVYPVGDGEALRRTAGIEAATGKVLGLDARGWRRGMPQDAGWIWDMEKELPGDLVARLPLEGGILVGAIAESPATQKLGPISIRRSGEWSAPEVPIPELAPLVFSELVRDLEGLRA